jgi:Flp pilus assembly protein TadB
MKKVIVTLVLVLVASFSYGQKSAEQRAKANTKEMVKVLSLDANVEAQIYEVNLVKNTKLMANDKLEQSQEEKRANRKAIYVAAGQKFKEIVGLEKMKVWWAYKAD